MITLTAAVRNSLPRVTYTKYSDWILMLCLVYVFGALVEFAVINFHESLEARKREKRNNALRSIDVERGVWCPLISLDMSIFGRSYDFVILVWKDKPWLKWAFRCKYIVSIVKLFFTLQIGIIVPMYAIVPSH